MLRCILICSGPQAGLLEESLNGISGVEVVRWFDSYPSREELLRTIRMREAHVLVLSVSDLAQFENLASYLDQSVPGFPVLAVGENDAAQNVELMSRLMHLGVRQVLSLPISNQDLTEAMLSCRHRLETHPLVTPKAADLFTFLPAKPGVGTTTLSVATSCALADNLSIKTLLMDCDLAAGTIQFLLRLGSSASVLDALQHAEQLDDDLWGQMLGHWHELEVLHAGRLEPPSGLNPDSVDHLFGAIRALYDVICIDLASSMDDLSVAWMQQSQRIFLVTTPEVVTLHMAALRLRRLTALGLNDRVSLLLNRRTPSHITDEDVAKAVGTPIAFSFGNEYQTVTEAIIDAAPVTGGSGLGSQVLAFAQTLVPAAGTKHPPHKATGRRFLEFFHIAHPDDLVA